MLPGWTTSSALRLTAWLVVLVRLPPECANAGVRPSDRRQSDTEALYGLLTGVSSPLGKW